MHSAEVVAENLLVMALTYARRGWPVFPVAPGQKTPLTKHGHLDATTDEKAIRSWWSRWPDANIGLATGRRSGMVVLDVDPRNGGDESLRALQKEHGPLPETIMASTGGGGVHHLFKHPDGVDVGCSTGIVGAGLDVKGEGGYVVVPPSLHPSGRTYQWDDAHHPDSVPLVQIPDWLLARMRAKTTKGLNKPFVAPDKILDGQRNSTLYRTARSLKAKGLGPESIAVAVHKENETKCSPPLERKEVDTIVFNATAQADRPEFDRDRAMAGAERNQFLAELEKEIAEVVSAKILREDVSKKIRQSCLTGLDRELLAGKMTERLKQITGVKVRLATVRKSLEPDSFGLPEIAAAPAWAWDWVYVSSVDRFFHLKRKTQVTEQGFNALNTRQMPRGESGRRLAASRVCLEEWGMPVVEHVSYNPRAAETFEMLGKMWANLYDPDSAPKVPDEYSEGDRAAIKKVLDHFERYLPDPRERQILLDWIAHNIQHPGVKIRWSPYIQGPEGDGKTFFFTLLGVCLGDRNIRTVTGSTLESNFTDWAVGYALICIEEMKQHGHNRYDVMNRLKPMITNDEIEIHPKGRASYCAINTANYMILSNYLDGAPVNDCDRRYCFLSSGLTKEDAKHLTGDGYYNELFKAVHEHGGAMRKWFLAHALDPHFQANGRAPETTMKGTIVEGSRNYLDSIVEDVLEAGGYGLHPDVISCSHFTEALRLKEVDVSKTKGTNAFLVNLDFIFIGRYHWGRNTKKIRIWVRRRSALGAKAEVAFGPDDNTPEQEQARANVVSGALQLLDIAAEASANGFYHLL